MEWQGIMLQFNKERFLFHFENALSVHRAFEMDAAYISDLKEICSDVINQPNLTFVQQLDMFAVNCSDKFDVPMDTADEQVELDPRERLLVDKYRGALFTFSAAVGFIVAEEGLSFSPEENKAFNKRLFASAGILQSDIY